MIQVALVILRAAAVLILTALLVRKGGKASSGASPPGIRSLLVQVFSGRTKINPSAFFFKLLSRRCVLVNCPELAKEVLSSPHLTDRPDLGRFHALFGGDRKNSMALCDWSPQQRFRKQVALVQLSDRSSLSDIIQSELDHLVSTLKNKSEGVLEKEHILSMTANVFTSFFCGKRFSYGQEDFRTLVQDYDSVFLQASRPHLSDFLPAWLSSFIFPFYMRGLRQKATSVRSFVIRHLLPDKKIRQIESERGRSNFTSGLWRKVDDGHMTQDSALFLLEDLLGGHSAAAHMLLRTLTHLALEPELQQRIRTGDPDSPLTQAVVLETLRMACSPIIPHVASRDVTIKGWSIRKGTWFLFNQKHMNSNPELWNDPENFSPDRFLDAEGQLSRPGHFFPFGGGSRACLGSRLVLLLIRSAIASILDQFEIRPVQKTNLGLGESLQKDFKLNLRRKQSP